MRFMEERKLNKKTQMRVIAYHNVLWEAYRSVSWSLTSLFSTNVAISETKAYRSDVHTRDVRGNGILNHAGFPCESHGNGNANMPKKWDCEWEWEQYT